jgi:O-antigen/teichoic acid export membrane protein
MIITLYTSRVILQILGVDDYGLYSAVGGIVGILAFFNGALSTSSSRYLTYELGGGNYEKLNRTFNTILTVHITIAIVIVILAEIVGLWFVYNKLLIPADRMNAALWVYHLSILTAIISITQVPYNASIIAHEKMNIYAYMSIIEVSVKLGAVYLLQIGNIDKLILYAILICVIHIGLALSYRFYCISKFSETHYNFSFDKNILKSIGVFSGWSLFAHLSIALNSQGITIITNIFFGASVVAAYVISQQVNFAANQFVQNFRTAVNVQIVKQYAVKDYDNSKRLLLNSAKFSFYLMLLIGLPIILLAEPLLQLWLGQVPQYTVIFVQLVIIQSLFSVFDTSFYTALYAKGRLKENALLSPMIGFIQFPVIYILFKSGYSPVVLSYAGVIVYALLGLIIKPILICKIANYTFHDVISVFISCLKVCVVAVPIPVIMNCFLNQSILNWGGICIISILSVSITTFYLGINANMRRKILCFAKTRLLKFSKI